MFAYKEIAYCEIFVSASLLYAPGIIRLGLNKINLVTLALYSDPIGFNDERTS